MRVLLLALVHKTLPGKITPVLVLRQVLLWLRAAAYRSAGGALHTPIPYTPGRTQSHTSGRQSGRVYLVA